MDNNSHGLDRNLYTLAYAAIHGQPTDNYTSTTDYRNNAMDQAMARANELGHQKEDAFTEIMKCMIVIDENTNIEEN